MSHWSDYIQVNEQTGTADERLLATKILDKGWESPDMRAKIESLPTLYEQRLREYEEIEGKPYSGSKASKVTIDIDNSASSGAYALDNKVVFSPQQSANLVYEDTQGKNIRMSPTSVLLHEIAGHMANPNEMPSKDFENTKAAFTSIFGNQLAKQYPEEHKKIAQDVDGIAALKTVGEFDAHMEGIKQKLGADLYTRAGVTAQHLATEVWNDNVENQAVATTDKILNETYNGENPVRGNYNIGKPQIRPYNIQELLDSVDKPESSVDAPKKLDRSSLLEGITMSSSNVPGGFTGKADGCSDPTHNHGQDVTAAPQFAQPPVYQR